jgi:hypothetical protein
MTVTASHVANADHEPRNPPRRLGPVPPEPPDPPNPLNPRAPYTAEESIATNSFALQNRPAAS